MLTNIGILCDQKNLKLSQLAERCGISVSYLSQISHGQRRNVNPRIIEAIAAELQVPVFTILSHQESIIPNGSAYFVLDKWGVPEPIMHEFKTFLLEVGQEKRDCLDQLFLRYEEWKLEKELAALSDEPNKVIMLIIAALLGGSIDLSLGRRIIDGAVIEPDQVFCVDYSSSLIDIKFTPSLVLWMYRDKLSYTIDKFLDLLQEDIGKAGAYLYLGDICYENQLWKIATEYFAYGILSLAGDEAWAEIDHCVQRMMELPESSLRNLVIAWQKGRELARYGDFKNALEFLIPAVNVQTTCEIERQYKSRIASTIGAVYMCIGENRDALKFLRLSIRLYSEGPLAGMTYVNLGTLLCNLGKFRSATSIYMRALENQQPSVITMAFAGLAQAALHQHNWTDARKFSLSGYWYAKRSKKLTGRGEVLINLGIYYREKGKPDKALFLLTNALNHAKNMNERRTWYHAQIEIADFLAEQGKERESEIMLDKLTAEIGAPEEVLILGFWQNLKASLYLHKSEAKKALSILNNNYKLLAANHTLSREFEKCLKLLEQTNMILHEPHMAQLYKEERLKVGRKIRRGI